MESKNMEYFCTLDRNLNNCPHFDGNNHCTNPETKCGMLRIQDNTKKNYIRKERWYEKYYKR